ncbi:bifunctional protein-serine/threonine kinase/phosphatase [Neptunomonas antarctica]|uniref:Serine/threonine protein phosphatase PrpC n=1 Tax=Neptunomonas antarctica TaxID=619304 RepID=A0A1N7KJE5_9GAMM|nr:bifunctional protein-serine/threonine kinase/phosphatase [Neptunomonas antarctica]SIS61705.1 Serine/threonine protein phosphatase PrpC [Neptunomonas antarctica]
MKNQLKVSVGQCSDKGRKESNQDFHGFYRPNEPQLSSKGIAFAMADGISSSQVSHIASETAVKSFLDDYFCTSEAWSVKNSAHRVITATNSWLHSQTRQDQLHYDKDKGYVCTLSALVIKSTTAYLFHVGDTRIYKLHDNALEQLTKDHRLWVSQDKSYLSRALGIEQELELDHLSLPLKTGDIFIMATDGVYEHVDAQFIINTLQQKPDSLDEAAKVILNQAYEQGSQDNLTIQIIRIDDLPLLNSTEIQQQIDELPFPDILQARENFDGYTILREVHATSRSHIYLALDEETNTHVILKTPSIDLRSDPAYLERFLMEEWIARRISSAHVLKAGLPTRKRNYLYTVTEFVDGQTLAQWLIDNPKPDLETVRSIIEQVAKGLRALHRMEILHQDLKPDNIMIDNTGTVKIIDFGSARVAGVVEATVTIEQNDILGTALYTAPEYFLGEAGSQRSDLYSLAVITYHMISREFPYDTQVSKSRTIAAQRRLTYNSVLNEEREIPAWVDETLKKALHPNPYKRYESLSEFLFDLRQPNKAFLNKTRPPIMDRNPVVFWQSISLILSIIIAALLIR